MLVVFDKQSGVVLAIETKNFQIGEMFHTANHEPQREEARRRGSHTAVVSRGEIVFVYSLEQQP